MSQHRSNQQDGQAERRNEVPVFIPVDFDIARCVRPKYRRYEDCVKWLLHTIYVRRLMLFTHDARRAGKPVNLKKKYLEKMIPCGKHLTDVLHDLISAGAVTCDEKQIGGKKSYGYACGPLFSRHFRRTIITDKCLCRKIARMRQDDAAALTDLQKWLLENLKRVAIDVNAATLSIINEPDDRHNLLSNQIIAIDDGQFFFHVDQFGRIHTNLTNLQTGLRSSAGGWQIIG